MQIHQRPYFIYELIDPRTQAIRYVGITVNPKARYLDHCRDSLPVAKGDWVNELIEQGLAPIMNIRETIMEGEEFALEREKYWIQTYAAQGIDLLNIKSMPISDIEPVIRQIPDKEIEKEEIEEDGGFTVRRTIVAGLITPEETAKLNLPEDTLVMETIESIRDRKGHVLLQIPPVVQYCSKAVLEYSGWTPTTVQVIRGDDLSRVQNS
jgi:hypothetical protein